MAMVGQPGGGPIKHLSGLGALVGFARAFEPRSSTGAVRGSLPGGVTGVGPLWWGAPPGRGEGTSPLAPHIGGTGPSSFSFSVAPGCVVRRVPVLRNRFYYFPPPPLAAVSRFLHWWLPLPPPAVIEYSLAFRSLAGMRVRRRNQRSQFVVRQYERDHFSCFGL